MTDDATTASNVDRLALLTTKLENEGKKTRYVLVFCTASILAIQAYTIITMYNDLPTIMLSNFMENMTSIVMHFKGVEGRMVKTTAPAAPAK